MKQVLSLLITYSLIDLSEVGVSGRTWSLGTRLSRSRPSTRVDCDRDIRRSLAGARRTG